MTVTLKATYEASGASPTYGTPTAGVYQRVFTFPGPLVAGDSLVAVVWCGNQSYNVYTYIAPTNYQWERKSVLIGYEAQASVNCLTVLPAHVTAGVTCNVWFDGADPYRIVFLHFDGPVITELVESYRMGIPGGSYSSNDYTIETSALAGEKLLYMVGERNALTQPSSDRGTLLYSEDGGHAWSVWTEDFATDTDVTVTLHVTPRSGHAHYVLRFRDQNTITTRAPVGSNRIGTAPFIEYGQSSQPTANQDFTTDPGEPQNPDWVTSATRPGWWRFKPTTTGWYKFDTEQSLPLNDGNTDTVLHVFWKNPATNSFQLLKTDDDAGALYTSIVDVYLTAGATYYARVDAQLGLPNIYYVLRVGKGDPDAVTPPTHQPDPVPLTVISQQDGHASFSAV